MWAEFLIMSLANSHYTILEKKQVNTRITTWVKSFLVNRTTVIKTNKYTSNKIDISVEISQRSLLLSIWYLFYNANSMEINNKYHEINLSGFIVDVTLITTTINTIKTNKLLENSKSYNICILSNVKTSTRC